MPIHITASNRHAEGLSMRHLKVHKALHATAAPNTASSLAQHHHQPAKGKGRVYMHTGPCLHSEPNQQKRAPPRQPRKHNTGIAPAATQRSPNLLMSNSDRVCQARRLVTPQRLVQAMRGNAYGFLPTKGSVCKCRHRTCSVPAATPTHRITNAPINTSDRYAMNAEGIVTARRIVAVVNTPSGKMNPLGARPGGSQSGGLGAVNRASIAVFGANARRPTAA